MKPVTGPDGDNPITDEQIFELRRRGFVGDAGRAALGECINRGFDGSRMPSQHERQEARMYCAEIYNARMVPEPTLQEASGDQCLSCASFEPCTCDVSYDYDVNDILDEGTS